MKNKLGFFIIFIFMISALPVFPESGIYDVKTPGNTAVINEIKGTSDEDNVYLKDTNPYTRYIRSESGADSLPSIMPSSSEKNNNAAVTDSPKNDSGKNTATEPQTAIQNDTPAPAGTQMRQPQQTYGNIYSDEVIYRENYKIADAVDPKKETASNSYPGFRGANQLIVYTRNYGLRTETNEFGTEAIIVNNMVVGLNGADSVIPYNGFVISGHGRAKTWIQKNLQIGSKVFLDYGTGALRVYLTPESLLFAANIKVKEVTELMDYYKQVFPGYNDKEAAANLADSKYAIKKANKKPEKTQEYINEAMESLDKAMKAAIPYKYDELKGIWLRPVETTPDDIEKTVERLAKTGITDIFLETYFHGKTIYPSRYLASYGVISQRAEFAGFDPLAVWIDSAHKHKMKLHIWFETYYLGNDNYRNIPGHVLSLYPSWSNKRYNSYKSEEPVYSVSEHNGYFLDPANPYVKQYLLGLLNEIITVYHPDGINLDYIRYPQTVDTSYSNYGVSNWGYTKTARDEFASIYGIDPVEVKYGSGNWELWAEYRQNKITEFVSDVRELTRRNKVMLTAVIFPDLRKCKATKMQNWHTWSVKNYVDGLTPLILTADTNTAADLIRDIKNNTNQTTKIYPGLFVTFMGGTYDELLMQIQKTREFRTSGIILFDYAHLTDNYIETLQTRVFNRHYDKKPDKKPEKKPSKKKHPSHY